MGQDAGGGVIPNIYEVVKYIQSSGTQFIDTLLVPTNNGDNFSLELSVQSSEGGLFGGFVWGGTYEYQIKTNTSYNWAFWYREVVGSVGFWVSGQSLDTVMQLELSPNGLHRDGVLIANFNRTNLVDFASIYLFGVHRKGVVEPYHKGSAKIYKFTFKDLSVMTPVIRKSDNKPGFYDEVRQMFLVNQGIGEFGYEKMDGTIVEPI